MYRLVVAHTTEMNSKVVTPSIENRNHCFFFHLQNGVLANVYVVEHGTARRLRSNEFQVVEVPFESVAYDIILHYEYPYKNLRGFVTCRIFFAT